MKIWNQYGSEHSANLMMIGHFEDVTGATKAMEIIELLKEQVDKDIESGTLVFGGHSTRYGKEMLNLLGQLNVASILPHEFEQFAYEVNVELKGQNLVITTDELDLGAFIKVLFLQGARIEILTQTFPDSV